MKNIILTGFMASGKTTVGKLLAKRLGTGFADTDILIEQRCGMKVSDIFKKFGEEYFRKKEKELSLELCKKNGFVIAVGGGFVLDKQNIENLRKNGIIVYLKTNPEIIKDRYERAKASRPLMRNEDVADVIKRFHEREKFYKNCDIEIPLIKDAPPERHVREILDKIKEII